MHCKKTSYRSLRYKRNHKRQYDRKDRYILVSIEKIAKTLNWSHRTQKSTILNVFRVIYQNYVFPVLWLNLYFFCTNMQQSISTIILSLMKFCVSQTSPRWCSGGSPGGWIKRIAKLVDKYHRKIHWKNYDDCIIHGGDI